MPATLSPIAAPHALQYAAQFGTSVIERAFLGATMGRSIRLEELAEHAPVLTPPAAAFYQQNCMVCFDLQRHASGVALNVAFADNEEDVAVEWSGEVTPDVHRSYLDREKRVDHGACAIALLLMPEFAGFVGVLTSAKGNGIDYYWPIETPATTSSSITPRSWKFRASRKRMTATPWKVGSRPSAGV